MWPEIVDGGAIYILICTVGSWAFYPDHPGAPAQSTGKTIYPMITQMAGALTNINPGPRLYLQLGMAVAGAAVATIMGQVWRACCPTTSTQKRNTEILPEALRGFRPDCASSGAFITVPAIHRHGVHRLGHDLLPEQDPDRFTTTAKPPSGAYFQAAELCIMPSSA